MTYPYTTGHARCRDNSDKHWNDLLQPAVPLQSGRVFRPFGVCEGWWSPSHCRTDRPTTIISHHHVNTMMIIIIIIIDINLTTRALAVVRSHSLCNQNTFIESLRNNAIIVIRWRTAAAAAAACPSSPRQIRIFIVQLRSVASSTDASYTLPRAD